MVVTHTVQSQRFQGMKEAVEVLLQCIGEDPKREGLLDTPKRVAKAWLDMSSGAGQDCKRVFGNAIFNESILASRPDGLVLVRDITFAALSDSNLLPFHGHCHIAYLPQHGKVLGLSKLARVARCLASRIQSQQQFTDDLLEAVESEVLPKGTAVIVQAGHLGVHGISPPKHTIAVSGCFKDDESIPMMELAVLLGCEQVLGEMEAAGERGVTEEEEEEPCCSIVSAASKIQMVEAARTLLQSIVQDTAALKALSTSPHAFVDWLLHSTAGYYMQLPACTSAGPGTPDQHSLELSDTSSDCMSEEAACFVNLREARGHSSEMSSAGSIETYLTEFCSLCEHHMLPFYGNIKIAYRTSGTNLRVDGAAALTHIVSMFSRRLQVQERLTQQIADAATAVLGVEAVLVVCQSSHMCMVARGVQEHSSSTVTTGTRGSWVEDATLRRHVLQSLLTSKA